MPSRINRDIKTALTDKGIIELNGFQKQAFKTFTDMDENLIVSAGTGRGKTEAVLVPLIHKLVNHTQIGQLKVIFIMPLVALANDQSERIESFLKKMNLSVFKYHGDVSSSKKHKFFRSPDEILIITPESLQSLLRKDKEFINDLFSSVEDVIIDEVHYFIGSQRGHHLYNLLWFLNRLTCNARITALSATINIDETVQSWFKTINNRELISIQDNTINQKISKLVYVEENKPLESTEIKTKRQKKSLSDEMLDDLVTSLRKNKGLIFFDDKTLLEQTANELNSKSLDILTHHGSLSKFLREKNEQLIKTKHNYSLCCTSTMELGIDIGDVDVVYFTVPPFSVASYLQRLGRSGRKTKTSKSKLYCSTKKDVVINYVIREMGAKNKVEVSTIYKHSVSKLFHQILCITNQKPITDTKKFYQFINTNMYFKSISYDELESLLKYMEDNNFLCTYGENLEIGDDGEELLAKFEMLSYFEANNKDIAVYDLSNNLLGSISESVFRESQDTKFSLNGQTWKPQKQEKNRVYVASDDNFEKIAFSSSSKQGKNTSISNNIYKYLVENELNLKYCDEKSKDILVEYRNLFRNMYEGKNAMYLTELEYAAANACKSLKEYKSEFDIFLIPQNIDINTILNNIDETEQEVKKSNINVADIKFSNHIDSKLLQQEAKKNTYDFEGLRIKINKIFE